jgi:Glutathione S-transferase, N-terminal domain
MDLAPATMTLFASSRSPFVRKVLVAAYETGVAERLRLERVVVSANKPNAAVMAANPLNKIPTLVLALWARRCGSVRSPSRFPLCRRGLAHWPGAAGCLVCRVRGAPFHARHRICRCSLRGLA